MRLPPALLCTASLFTVTAHAQSPSAEWAALCEARLPATSIEVRTVPAPIRYLRNRSVDDLTQLQHLPQDGARTLGLTEVRLGTSIQYKASTLARKGEPLTCMRPSIVVTLSLDPHVVSVASEFGDDSCAYRHILAHEMRHVDINRLTLDTAADRMREGMRSSFGNKVYFGEPAELQERLTRHIREQWLPWVDAQMKHTMQRHREIDTPEEYARNQKVCGGEIARVLAAQR